jgi:hypothetical protein
MQDVVVLSKLIPFVEKWMSPHTVVIPKVMDFNHFVLTRNGTGSSIRET